MKITVNNEEVMVNTRENQQNMLAYERLTAKYLPDVSFFDEDGVQATMSRLKLPFMNDITPTNVKEERIEAIISRFTNLYLAKNIRPTWRVWDVESSNNLREYLEALNYQKAGYQTAMSMNIDNWTVVGSTPRELSIYKVEDEATCGHYASVLAQSLNIPEHELEGFQDFLNSVGCDHNAPLQHYVAYEKCEPVSVLSLFYNKGTVGIYNIQTLQRKGSALSHLLIHAVKDAQERGAQKVTLQTSDKDVQIYERLGFHNDGNILEYRIS